MSARSRARGGARRGRASRGGAWVMVALVAVLLAVGWWWLGPRDGRRTLPPLTAASPVPAIDEITEREEAELERVLRESTAEKP